MTTYLDLDGVVVDPETGEVIQSTVGDYLAWAAAQLSEAAEQEATWGQRKKALSRLFVREQSTPKAEYGGIVVSIPKPGSHPEFDQATYAMTLASEEWTRDELLELAARSKPDWSLFAPGHLRDFVSSFYRTVVHAPYARASRPRKPAVLRVVERDEEEAS